MIKTSRQLKALVSNQAKGDSGKSQLLIRNYAMERFLERVSLSKYKDNFILKGGMLVSAMVGSDNRATMDIDTTIRNLPLNSKSTETTVETIIAIQLEDNIIFTIKSISDIMDDAEYSGIRLALEAHLDTMRIPLKIDISTGDVITPAEIEYQYKLMFEDRTISVWSYPIETVLAEKLETVLSRALTNTRFRDFYDIYILQNAGLVIDYTTLSQALTATSQKRKSENILPEYNSILNELKKSQIMQELWENYQHKNSYADGISWNIVLESVLTLCSACIR